MTTIAAWLEQQLNDALPSKSLAPGEASRNVRAIAEAVGALEGRTATAFGMHLTPEQRAECSGLTASFREGIVAWRELLGNELGEKGERFVDRITLAQGFRVAPPKPLRCEPLGSAELLDGAQRAAVARLSETLADPAARVWLGEGDEDTLRDMAEAFEHLYDTSFPVDLAHVLSLHNGISVAAEAEGGVSRVPASELTGPVIWPARVYGDHFLLHDARISETVPYYVIGGVDDSGFLALGIEGDDRSPPVLWIDRDFATVAPHQLAGDVAGFLTAWCEAALSLPRLLGRTGAPGWST